jgi:hypothetical protein
MSDYCLVCGESREGQWHHWPNTLPGFHTYVPIAGYEDAFSYAERQMLHWTSEVLRLRPGQELADVRDERMVRLAAATAIWMQPVIDNDHSEEDLAADETNLADALVALFPELKTMRQWP